MAFKMKGFSYPGKSPIKINLKGIGNAFKNMGKKAAKTDAGQDALGGIAEHLGKRIIDRILPSKGSSPLSKKQDKKQVPLSKYEKKKGTKITGGSKTEVINDLEDRIEFLRSDLQGYGKGKVPVMKVGKQLNKLQTRLRKEYQTRDKKAKNRGNYDEVD